MENPRQSTFPGMCGAVARPAVRGPEPVRQTTFRRQLAGTSPHSRGVGRAPHYHLRYPFSALLAPVQSPTGNGSVISGEEKGKKKKYVGFPLIFLPFSGHLWKKIKLNERKQMLEYKLNLQE